MSMPEHIECGPRCAPRCHFERDLTQGHPYQLMEYYWDPLPCAWQQPDFRPLYFATQTRFPSKERYGPQCFAASGKMPPPRGCCVPNCGCPAEHVAPFPGRNAVFLVRPDAEGSFEQTTDWAALVRLLCNDNVDVVRVLCEGTPGRMALQRFLLCCDANAKQGDLASAQAWKRRSKIHTQVCHPPLTDALAQCYMKRFMWWQRG